MPSIRSELADQIGTIAFDSYANRNALSSGLIGEVLAALATLREAKARVVILTTAAPNLVWSSGHDVKELPVADQDPLPFDDPLEKLLRAVREFPAPVMAMVHGSVWGGACDLIMSCDVVIGDESCSFAITPAKLGLPYNVSGIQHFMSRLPLNVVKEMFFSAEPIGAARAEQVGIVNQIVRRRSQAATRALAKTIASRSPHANAAFKAQVRILSDAGALSPSTFELSRASTRSLLRRGLPRGDPRLPREAEARGSSARPSRASSERATSRGRICAGGQDRLERADAARALDGVDRVELRGELAPASRAAPRRARRSKALARRRARVRRAARCASATTRGSASARARTSRAKTTAAAGPPPITEA